MAKRRRQFWFDDHRGRWPEYVSVGERRARAEAEVKYASKQGAAYRPAVLPAGRKLARTTWGQAWCRHIESFQDYSNRLPRGRSYARNGSIIDLQIERGQVRALVVGSEVYAIEIEIARCKPAVWSRVRSRAAGGIGSLIELLEGRLSESVMTALVGTEDGLLPDLRQVTMTCSCPDWARLCKHLAAVLYGIGARLDEEPEVLFTLRGVEPADLVSAPVVGEGARPTGSRRLDGDLSAVFGIDLGDSEPSAEVANRRSSRAKAGASAASPTSRARPAKRPPTKPSTTKRLAVVDSPVATKTSRLPIGEPRLGDLVTRADLLKSGVSAAAIRSWLAAGVLGVTAAGGVYCHTAESRRRVGDRR